MRVAQCPEEESNQKTQQTKQAEITCKEVCLRYSLPVLLGRWYDLQCLRNERSEKLEEKRKTCDTFEQKKKIVLKYLSEPILLAKFTDFLFYDVPIKIISDYRYPADEDNPYPRPLPVKIGLSTLLLETQIENNFLKICDNSVLTVSEMTSHIRRNVFCLVSCDTNKTEKAVCYNENLYIRLHDSGSSEMLYIKCEIPTVDAFGLNKERFMLCLTSIPDRYCIFKIVNAVTSQQIITLGKEVPSNKRVLIRHALSNRDIAVEMNDFLQSSMFERERLTSCFNYRDIYRQPLAQNYWIITTRQEGEDARQMDADKDEKTRKSEEDAALQKKMVQRKAEREALMTEVTCIKNPLMNFAFLP